MKKIELQFLFCLVIFLGFNFMLKPAQAYTYSGSYNAFNGSTSYGDIGDVLKADYNTYFNFSIVFRKIGACNGAGGWCALFAKQENSGNFRGYSMFLTNTGTINLQLLSVGGGANGIEVLGQTTGLDDGYWHKVVATYGGCGNASCVSITVDNVYDTLTIVQNNLTTSIDNTASWLVGKRGTGYFFPGDIGEMSISLIYGNSSFETATWFPQYTSGGVMLDKDITPPIHNMTMYNITTISNAPVSGLIPEYGHTYLPGDTIFYGNYNNPGLYDEVVVETKNTDNFTILNGYFPITGTSGSFNGIIPITDQGNYQWTAWLENTTTGQKSAPMPLIWYIIGSTSTPPYAPPDIYETVCEGDATSTITGMLICAFKKGAVWTFYPSDSSLKNFTSAYNSMKRVFPFNAFFDLTDTFNSAIASTSTTTTGYLKIPFISATSSHFTMLGVVSSSTLSKFIGQTNANLFRNSITWFLWLIACAVVYFTFKRI